MDERGPTLIAVAGAEYIPAQSAWSIYSLQRRKGDEFYWQSATRGDTARQSASDLFMKYPDRWAALLYLDADHTYPKNLIDVLWNYGVDIVSGFYVRRCIPPVPVWFAPHTGFPLEPYWDWPRDVDLCEIGATGFGCLLVKRRVFEKIEREILKPGEGFICNGPYPERAGKWGMVGADIRFCDMARRCGFKVFGAPKVKCGHVATVVLGAEHYDAAGGLLNFGPTLAYFAEERIRGGMGMDKELIHTRIKAHEIEMEKMREQLKQLMRVRRNLELGIIRHDGAIEELKVALLAEERTTDEAKERRISIPRGSITVPAEEEQELQEFENLSPAAFEH